MHQRSSANSLIRALVKKTSINRLPFLKREYDAYETYHCVLTLNGQRSSVFRRPYNSPCLVFEWMDYTVDHISSKTYQWNSILLKAIAGAVFVWPLLHRRRRISYIW